MTDEELRAGLYAFDLVQKRAKRPTGAPDKGLARPVTTVGVVGAGLMASQLALLCAFDAIDVIVGRGSASSSRRRPVHRSTPRTSTCWRRRTPWPSCAR